MLSYTVWGKEMFNLDLNVKGKKPKDLYDEDVAYFYGLLFSDDKEMATAVKYFSNMIKKDKVNATIGTVFKYSNENLRKLFEELDVKGKKVLTVGSSGDQVLNAIYYGAKQVDFIDANVFSRPFIELKMAAIKGLGLDDFLACFKTFNISENNFLKYYKMFSGYLPEQTKYFWDNVFLDGMADRLTNIIGTFNGGISKRGSEFYADPKSFEKLKNILIAGDYEVRFANAEFRDFPSVVEDKYDLILLSNIIDYFSTEKEEKKFKQVIKKLYKNSLNSGGFLQITSSMTQVNEAYRVMRDLGLEYVRIENGGFDYHDAIMIQKPSEKQLEK